MTIDPIEAVDLAGRAARIVVDITALTRRPSPGRVLRLLEDIEGLAEAVRKAVRT